MEKRKALWPVLALVIVLLPPVLPDALGARRGRDREADDDAADVMIHVIADDFFQLYVNGRRIGQNREIGHAHDVFHFSTTLGRGDVIGVDVQNGGGPAGLYVFVQHGDDHLSFGTDGTWQYAKSDHVAWARADNAAEGWEPCSVVVQDAILQQAPDPVRAKVIWGSGDYCLIRKIVDFEGAAPGAQGASRRLSAPAAMSRHNVDRARFLRQNAMTIEKGMRRGDVTQLLGDPDVEMGFTGTAAQRRQCLYCEYDVVVSVWIDNAVVRTVKVLDVTPRMIEYEKMHPDEPFFFGGMRNVRKGLSAEAVLQELGKPTLVRHRNRNFRHFTFLFYESHGHRCEIKFENGIVDTVRTEIEDRPSEQDENY